MTLPASRFPAESGAACAGNAPSVNAVTAAANGRIGDFDTYGTIPAIVQADAITKQISAPFPEKTSTHAMPKMNPISNVGLAAAERACWPTPPRQLDQLHRLIDDGRRMPTKDMTHTVEGLVRQVEPGDIAHLDSTPFV